MLPVFLSGPAPPGARGLDGARSGGGRTVSDRRAEVRSWVKTTSGRSVEGGDQEGAARNRQAWHAKAVTRCPGCSHQARVVAEASLAVQAIAAIQASDAVETTSYAATKASSSRRHPAGGCDGRRAAAAAVAAAGRRESRCHGKQRSRVRHGITIGGGGGTCRIGSAAASASNSSPGHAGARTIVAVAAPGGVSIGGAPTAPAALGVCSPAYTHHHGRECATALGGRR